MAEAIVKRVRIVKVNALGGFITKYVLTFIYPCVLGHID